MRRDCLSLAIVLLAAAMSQAPTPLPMLTHSFPVALQRGKTTEIAVDGQMTFFGAYKALFEGTGITAEVVPQNPPAAVPPAKPLMRSIKLKVTVAADASLG